MSLLGRLKWWLGGVIERNPYGQFYTKKLLLRLPILLPHDRSYLGLRHLQDHPNQLIVDVGANDGISALGFRRLSPRWGILSIEPSTYHAASLERLKRRMHGFDYIITGAGDEVASLELHTPVYKGVPLHTAASLSAEQARQSIRESMPSRVFGKVRYESQTVPVIPLDDLELRPGIIKIDAEGFDDKVLRGLKKTIQNHRPYVLVELHPSTEQGVRELCQEMQYTLFRYDEVRDAFVHYDGTEVRNVFCIPHERSEALPRPA